MEAMRPQATRRAYDPKIAEYEAYAAEAFKGEPDWDMVTGPHLFLFLHDKVVGRRKREEKGTLVSEQ